MDKMYAFYREIGDQLSEKDRRAIGDANCSPMMSVIALEAAGMCQVAAKFADERPAAKYANFCTINMARWSQGQGYAYHYSR